jgi:hypothetical protein
LGRRRGPRRAGRTGQAFGDTSPCPAALRLTAAAPFVADIADAADQTPTECIHIARARVSIGRPGVSGGGDVTTSDVATSHASLRGNRMCLRAARNFFRVVPLKWRRLGRGGQSAERRTCSSRLAACAPLARGARLSALHRGDFWPQDPCFRDSGGLFGAPSAGLCSRSPCHVQPLRAAPRGGGGRVTQASRVRGCVTAPAGATPADPGLATRTDRRRRKPGRISALPFRPAPPFRTPSGRRPSRAGYKYIILGLLGRLSRT